jgi:threonylcarbamoyladenosine tRNA methylthiotransferase MtaB
MNLNVSFFTLGCKVNQFETDVMIENFRKEGFFIVEPSNQSDIFVVNSCTVTKASERKTKNMVKKFRSMNESAIIILTGCYAQANTGNLEKFEFADIIIGTKNKAKVVDYVKEFLTTRRFMLRVEPFKPNEEYEEISINATSERTRANIKIQDGCRQFCTYCIIPFVRGPLRSRKINFILSEIQNLHDNGYKEIVLNGIHMTSYGVDLDEDVTLIELVKSINQLHLDDIRFRFGSLEPGAVNDELILAMMEGNFCDHFHLSLQSGSNSVLKRMNRRYTIEEYWHKISLIRSHMPNAGITTDVIVGFPGETEEEFEETCQFIKRVQFSKVHVFTYSKREGTKAATMVPQIPTTTKKKRASQLIELCDEMSERFCSQFIGTEMDVLYEALNKENYFTGHTSNYLMVHSPSKNNLHNIRKKVKMTESKGHVLLTEEVTI